MDRTEGSAPSVLCLGAHSDDIEIGALATILALARRYDGAKITWVVFAAEGPRADEARASAEHCTREFESANVEIHAYRDGLFPAELEQIKQAFEALKGCCNPDIIFTHYRQDLHQDHRVISDLTWQTFRNHLILEYEIPKYDGDLGSPNLFFPVSQELHDEKITSLDTYFESQQGRNWFSPDTFTALMRLRGIETHSTSGFAEAFYCRKLRFLP